MTQGVVVWITGLPSAGKSRFARGLSAGLKASETPVCLLDSDEVRAALPTPLGYSPAERASFYESLAQLAALFAGQGLIVLVAATAHRRAFRERARELSPAYLEVWVDTPVEECARRDSKGLYKAQGDGRASDVPGRDTEYEQPRNPDVIAHGGMDAEAVATVLRDVARLRSGTGGAASP